VLIAGVAGMKSSDHETNVASATFLRRWVEERIFVWLISDEILEESREVLARLAHDCATAAASETRQSDPPYGSFKKIAPIPIFHDPGSRWTVAPLRSFGPSLRGCQVVIVLTTKGLTTRVLYLCCRNAGQF
jgi:hypothetical protein